LKVVLHPNRVTEEETETLLDGKVTNFAILGHISSIHPFIHPFIHSFIHPSIPHGGQVAAGLL
jgi:hypothetical protein